MKINDIEFNAGRWPMDPELDTIVFIHGSGGSNVLWDRQVEDLAGQMNTIALNLPGHGSSEGSGMDRIEDYADSVLKFIKALDTQKPVICGLSIGGAVVLQMLINQPETCKAGIVINSGAKLKVMPQIFEMIENDFSGFVNSMYSFGISKQTDPAKLKPVADSMLACSPAVTRKDFAACNAFDVREKLNTIKTPVLVMTASDDLLTPVKYGRFLADRIPGAVITTMENAGHLSPIEKPETVSKAIFHFLGNL